MKKKFILLLVAFSFCSTVMMAQGFQFGVKAGADLQKIEGKLLTQSFSFGYHAGVYAQLSINKTFSIQPELYYSEVKLDTANDFSTVYHLTDASSIKFGYINIPVLLNIKAGKKFTIQMGPRFGILANSNASIISNGQDAVKKGDLALVAGMKFSFSRVNVYGRYQVGVSNVNDVSSQEKWKSQTVHLGIGLRII